MDLIDEHHSPLNSNQLQAVPHPGRPAVLLVLQHQQDLRNCLLTITKIITEVFKEVELFVGVEILSTTWLQPNLTPQQRLQLILLQTTMRKISTIPFMDKISLFYRYISFCSSHDLSYYWSGYCDLVNLLEILTSSFRKLNDEKLRFKEVGADSDSH